MLHHMSIKYYYYEQPLDVQYINSVDDHLSVTLNPAASFTVAQSTEPIPSIDLLILCYCNCMLTLLVIRDRPKTLRPQ